MLVFSILKKHCRSLCGFTIVFALAVMAVFLGGSPSVSHAKELGIQKRHLSFSPGSGPYKMANVPDPLDFASQVDDPEEYGIPDSAKRYKEGNRYEIPGPKPGGRGKVPDDARHLAAFYQQKIEWGSCRDFNSVARFANDYIGSGIFIECGYMIVPISYESPGKTAAIALMRLRPASRVAGAAPRGDFLGTIFVNPGGPGGSGLEMLYGLAMEQKLGGLTPRFDIVGFDPRGVGASLPMIRCQSSAAIDAERYGSDDLSPEKLDAIAQHNAQECYRNTGRAFGINGEEFIYNVDTFTVAKDLDIARAIMGDKKLNFLGYSYGTSIGYAYAQSFPDRVRSMVLDSAMNPFSGNSELMKKYQKYVPDASGKSDAHDQLRSIQKTLNEFMLKCSAEDGFMLTGVKIPCALGRSGNLDTLLKEYQKIVQAAYGGEVYESQPHTPRDRPRPLSFADAVQGTVMAMYNEKHWPQLNMALMQMKKHSDGTLMLDLADVYYNRLPSGLYSQSDAAFRVIWCTDYGAKDAFATIEARKNYMMQQYAVAPFTDPGVDAYGAQRGIAAGSDMCKFFKHTQKFKAKEFIPGANILVIGTTRDAATPFYSGVIAAAALRGTMLVVAGNNHTAYLHRKTRGSAVEKIVENYFETLNITKNERGAENVDTLDLYSKPIKGPECSIYSFR